MTRPPNPLDAFDEPPTVHALDGEVLLSGPHAEAAYTVPAARELARRLTAVLDAMEQGE